MIKWQRVKKNPIIVEALHFTKKVYKVLKDGDVNKLLRNPRQGQWYFCHDKNLVISTLEGDLKVSIGDWIIRDIDGGLYPCKSDMFEKAYSIFDNQEEGQDFIKLTIECVGICCGHKEIINVDVETFDTDWGYTQAFCKKCLLQKEWFAVVCSGCVEGWKDLKCKLAKSFLYEYSEEPEITKEDLKLIEKGICPRKTNGSICFNPKVGFEEIPEDEKASPESSKAVADAIRMYLKKYRNERK